MTKRIIFPILCTLSCLLTLMACLEEKDPLNYSPNVATGTATDIGYTNATLSGTIRQNTGTHIADGGILLSERSDMEAYTKLEVTASAYSSFTTVADNLTPGTVYYYCAYASSGYSLVRGEIKSFTTQEGVAPVFGNAEITGHDEKSATVTANITDKGGSELVLCGVRYWEATNGEEQVETGGTLVTTTPGTEFTVTIPNLLPSTEYIVCPVAQNATGVGYGPKLHVTTDEAVLPVLSAITPIDSTVVSIEVSAQVVDAGKSALKEVGFCWSMESQEPTPSHNHQSLPLPADGEAFSFNIENLTADQTYYIRAYAYNDEEEPGYSTVKVFRTTSSAPSVEQALAEDIAYTTATLKARIASHGGLPITAKGFYYSDTNDNPGEGDQRITATNAETDSIIAAVEGLASHTTYHVRAFATNARGTSVSEEVYTFTTADDRTVPTVETAEATNIGSMTATLNGRIAADGNTPITSRGFCYGTDANPAQNGTRMAVEGDATDFTLDVSGLKPSTTYYVCAYAENEIGPAYGEVVSFTTEDRVPGIYSLEELIALRDAINNGGDTSPYINAEGVANLYTDIDMSPIDDWEGFVGWRYIFEGNGHTISNVRMINTEEGGILCFFGNISATGVVRNLTMTGEFTSDIHLAYASAFSWEFSGVISNCHSYVNITTIDGNVGGIVTRNFGLIENCTNHGNLVGGSAGGIYDHGWSFGTLTSETRNCTNYGRVEALDGYAGGIAADSSGGNIFSNCINEGEVISANLAGGIIGYCANGITLTNCKNRAAVTGTYYAGGIIGQLNNSDEPITLTDNTHTGTVNGEPASDENAIGYDGRNQQ